MENTIDTVKIRSIRQAMKCPANDLQDRAERDPVVVATMTTLEHDARLFGAACRDDMAAGVLSEADARYAIRVHVALADADYNLTAQQMTRLADAAFRTAGLKAE